LEVER
jgi:hypothetical protein